MNNKIAKIILIIIMLIYIFSPVDAMPGPIDDFIVLLLGYIAQNRLGKRAKAAEVIGEAKEVEEENEKK